MKVRESGAAYRVSIELEQCAKDTDVGRLPADWQVNLLHELASIRTGIAKNGGVAIANPVAVHYLRVANVQDGYLDLSEMSQLRVRPEDVKKYAVLPGDMLMNEGGDLDKLGRGALWNGEFDPCVHQNHVFVVRCGSRLLPRFLSAWTGSAQARQFFMLAGRQTTNLASINKTSLGQLPIPLPPTKSEQQAIAEALSNADSLIESLSLLLAKKRQIKQGTMQELLTGKKRLPRFSGKWKTSPLGNIAHIKTGKRNNQDKVEDGQFPFFVRSAEVERIDSYSYDCEAILVPGEGGIGSIFHYMDGRFDVHQRVYAITQFAPGVLGKYVHLYMSQYFGPYAMQNSVKATVDSLRLPTFQSFAVRLPPTAQEQAAIANVVGELEEQIATMEMRLAKARDLKQGMMQALLTGRIRLMQPTSNVIPLPLKPAAAHPPPPQLAHNWQINEAVVIGVLAQRFGSEKFPLPRKRRVKLMYLLHRHAEGRAEGYLKKAAGPYNPNTKYKGPEAIALKNGYVQALHNGTYDGFVAGDKAEQAQRYFEQWYGTAALDWLERFHYRKTDDLELLATVDMAMVDLAAMGQPADVAGVKRVIAAHPEWVPKLSRELFSEENIARATAECATLFTAQ